MTGSMAETDLTTETGATPDVASPPQAGTVTLREQIALVAGLRRQAVVFGASMQRIRDAFEEAHQAQFQRLADMKAELEAEEQRLRQLTLGAYKATGEKKPAPGVSVRLTTELVYEDAAAFAWAKERGLALTLDQKAFNAIAKVTPLDFVTRRKVPQAMLAKDLAGGEDPDPAPVAEAVS